MGQATVLTVEAAETMMQAFANQVDQQTGQKLEQIEYISTNFTGWIALFSNVADGDRIVPRLEDYYGGVGPKPSIYAGGTARKYLGASGFVTDIAQATNVRGLPGPKGDQGNKGWTAITANIVDGARVVPQVIDWTGGEGAKPPTGQYIGPDGLVSNIAQATNIRGLKGDKGDTGNKGWTGVTANVPDGARVVQQVTEWIGGEGTKPALTPALYVSPTGFTSIIADATDIKGGKGDKGDTGDTGPVGLNLRGAWQANTDYVLRDAVESGGSSYYCITPHASGSSFSVGSNWKLYAQGGSVADNTITPQKTSFSVAGSNLFNINDPGNAIGYYQDYNSPTPIANPGYNLTHYIPVSASSWYYPSVNNRVVFYDAAKVFISGINIGRTDQKFQIPANCAFVRLSALVANWATLMLNAGQTGLPWEPYSLLDGNYVKLPNKKVKRANIDDGAIGTDQLSDATVTPVKTSFFVIGKNKFNSNDPGNQTGYYIDSTVGLASANASYNATGYIPVKAGTWYYPGYKHQLAFYDSSKNYISGLPSGRTDSQFQTPANCAFVRLSVHTTAWATFQLEEGTTGTSYEAYRLYIDAQYISILSSMLADGSITNTKLAAGAVSFDKANFFKPGKNLFNKATATDGFYINESGFIGGNANYCYSDFIAVTPGLAYYGKDSSNGNMRFVTYYDLSRQLVAGGLIFTSSFTPPVGVSYVRITITAGNKATFQLEQAAAATTFEPFGPVIILPDGTPVQASAINTTVLQAAVTEQLAGYQDELAVAIAPKIYTVVGKEVAVFAENLHKNFAAYRDKTEISITGGYTNGRKGYINPGSAGTIAATVKVGNKKYELQLTVSFSVIASPAGNTNAVKVLNLGDSYTYRSSFVTQLQAIAGANVTFLGIRNSSVVAGVKCEGRGGWSMSGYTTFNYNLYNPFMQPTATYLYLGNTTFWKNANAGLPGTVGNGYDENNFAVANQFSPSTGYPVSPRTNDLIYDNSTSEYKAWNGSAWATVSAPTFAFSFSKYRQCWSIAAPDIVHVLLGTNDFAGATETGFAGSYANFKAGYDTIINSIKADVPTCKIIVGIPVSRGRSGEFGTLSSEQGKRVFWLLANALIADYKSREGEGIYLNDYHSVVDRQYGFPAASEKPFPEYPGTDTIRTLTDFVHIENTGGFLQMGNAYAGLIQALR